jgi:hypothetical protein
MGIVRQCGGEIHAKIPAELINPKRLQGIRLLARGRAKLRYFRGVKYHIPRLLLRLACGKVESK